MKKAIPTVLYVMMDFIQIIINALNVWTKIVKYVPKKDMANVLNVQVEYHTLNQINV